MRLPILGGMWPSRTAPPSLDPEMPPMVETAQSSDDLQPRETLRSHPRSTFGRQVLAFARRGRFSQSTALSDRETGNTDSGEEAESPKTPQFQLGMPALPSARLQLPHLTRTWTTGLSAPSSRPPTASANQPHAGPDETWQRPPSSARSESTNPTIISEPPRVAMSAVTPGRAGTPRSSEEILGQVPPNLSPQEAQARGAMPEGAAVAVVTDDEQTARKFMGCFPWIRSRRVRSQISRCLVSGVLLLLLLATYLSLSLTQSLSRNSEFSVLLILVVLFAAIFFCHALIRLCMLVTRPRPDDDRPSDGQGIIGFAGFSLPRRPVRVLLARDEEAAGMESETTKLRPPAYGLWRESVRVDPNRLFWQRNEETQLSEASPPPETQTVQRPPSYASDDGVGYVVDAVPRSTAPTTDMSLPVHPSERGRLDARGMPW